MYFDVVQLRFRRKRNLAVLGVVLVAAFLLPVVTVAKVSPSPTPRGFRYVRPNQPVKTELQYTFPYAELAGSDNTSWQKAVAMVVPLAGGLLALAGAAVLRHPQRGILLIAAALGPVVLFAAAGAPEFLSDRPTKAGSDEAAVAMLGVVAAMVMVMAVRARWYRPGRKDAYYLGLAGAACFLVYFVLRIGLSRKGHAFLPVPVKAGNMTTPALAAGGLGCLALAAVLCLANAPSRKGGGVRGMAWWSFSVVFLGGALMGLSGLVAIADALPGVEGKATVLFFLTLKLGCWLGGLFALLPTGVIDLMIGPPKTRAEAVVASARARGRGGRRAFGVFREPAEAPSPPHTAEAMISFACPRCGTWFRVADDRAGQSVTCSACRHDFPVPESPVARGVPLTDDGLPPSPAGEEAPPPLPPVAHLADPLLAGRQHEPPGGGDSLRLYEGAQRRKNMVTLGAVLIVGFLLPQVTVVTTAKKVPYQTPGGRSLSREYKERRVVMAFPYIQAFLPASEGGAKRSWSGRATWFWRWRCSCRWRWGSP